MKRYRKHTITVWTENEIDGSVDLVVEAGHIQSHTSQEVRVLDIPEEVRIELGLEEPRRLPLASMEVKVALAWPDSLSAPLREQLQGELLNALAESIQAEDSPLAQMLAGWEREIFRGTPVGVVTNVTVAKEGFE